MVRELDAALRHFAEVVERQPGVHVLDVPGAGAAGGLGAGLLAFAGGQLRRGVDIVAEACDLDGRVRGADLVITGEGTLDAQTAEGKTPLGVTRIAKRHGIPVVAIAGALRPGYEALFDMGVDAAFSICSGPMTVAEAMADAEKLLGDTAEAVVRAWRIGSATRDPE
jgi:glycerate kinase